jgi:predicted phosphodiesterase
MQHYLKAAPKRPEGAIAPARTDGPRFKAREVKRPKTRARTAVYISDQHAPYQDERLHELTCQWLADHQPSQVILGGDLLEADTISRWRKKPQHQAVQKGLDEAYRIVLDYRTAAPRANFVMLPGNHDERIQNLILDQAPELHGLRPGGNESLPEALSLQNLLRLDELGVELIPGSYEGAQVVVTPYLAARHGYKALKGAGKTGHATMTELGHSVVVGHVHRQAISYRTIYDTAGEPSMQVGVEAGCMCSLDLANTYTTSADWQQGFATFEIFPDGTFHTDLATYVKGNLHWRGERW